MKLFLNIILILIAVSSILISILQSFPMELKATSLATAIACIGATFSNKKYRYILAGIALIFIILSYILQGSIYDNK